MLFHPAHTVLGIDIIFHTLRQERLNGILIAILPGTTCVTKDIFHFPLNKYLIYKITELTIQLSSLPLRNRYLLPSVCPILRKTS